MAQTKDPTHRGKGGLYFLLIVVIAYLLLALFVPQKVSGALRISAGLLLEIIPVLLFVMTIMALIDFYLKPGQIKKWMGKESGAKGWLIAIAFGIISHGSIYAWYPLLKELKEHGMREGLMATFIYCRAIKIPFIPLLIYYFGLKFFVVLVFYMIISSVLEGLIFERF